MKKLLDNLDEAMFEPAGWVAVCDTLSSMFDGIGTMILPLDPLQRGPGLMSSRSIADMLETYFSDGWHMRDERQKLEALVRIRGYATELDLNTESDRSRLPYYQDLMRPNDLETFLGMHFSIGADGWVLCVQRRIGAEPINDAMISKIDTVRKIVRQSAMLVATSSKLKIEQFKNILEVTKHCVLLLDRQGKMVELGRVELAMVPGLILTRNACPLHVDPVDNYKLQRLITSVCNPLASTRWEEPFVHYTVGGRSFSFDAMPLPRDMTSLGQRSVAVLIVRETTGAEDRKAIVLQKNYRLTPSESNCALLIYDGQSIAEAAGNLGFKQSTVRQYLKSVYQKCRVSGQPQLVGLISRL